MCGLWGFAASARAPHGNRPAASALVQIALGAGTRGPHACGWWTPAGGLVRHLGPLEGYYADVMKLAAPLIVGHARLATVGAPDDRGNVQPLEWGGIVIAHNGIIPGAGDLWQHVPGGGQPRTTNDSEVLAALIAQAPGPDLVTRVEWAMSLLPVPSERRHALLATDGRSLVAARFGQPLYRAYAREGAYVCSRAVPAGATLLPADSVTEVTA